MATTIKMISHKITEYPFVEVYPISDLHVGSKEFNEGEFQKLSREILAEPNRYVVVAGDLCDEGLISSVTSPYDAVLQPAAQRKFAAELLYPLKDRILAICSGNHEFRGKKVADVDACQLVAERLDLSHLFNPDLAFIKLDLGERTSHNLRPPRYCIAVTHGASNGMMLGAGLSKAEPFALAIGADLLIMGHSHRPATAPTARLECSMQQGVMVMREVRIMAATGFLDYGGYPARKMLKPVTIRPNKAILQAKSFDIAVLS